MVGVDLATAAVRAVAADGAGGGSRRRGGHPRREQGGAAAALLPRRELRVDRQVVLRAGHPPVIAPPKTDASFRTIPLPARVAALMSSHLAVFPATTRPEHGALIFTTTGGEPIRRNRFGDVWRAAVRRSGARPDLTFHDLRHYYASC